MKKRIVSIVLYFIIILLSGYFVIYPNVKTLINSNKVKELTYEEKTKLIQEIEEKYDKNEEEIKTKYENSLNEIKESYVPKLDEISNKYDALKKELDTKYENKEKELSKKINSKKVEETREFFANGLSEKYYTISDEVMKLTKEKNNLDFEKSSEERKLEQSKQEEINLINNKENEEIRKNEENQLKEINGINQNKLIEINKINEKNKENKIVKERSIFYIIVGIVIILIPLIYVMVVYNKLTKLYNKVKEKWSAVNVYLKQRTDLIPNIVETVKGYSGYEKDTLTEIISTRNKVLKSESKKETIEENEKLSKNLNALFVLAESYPELRANDNFISLQNSLKEIENKISLSRTDYNKAVLNYKNKIEMFPSNIVGQIFNFKPELFFEIEKDEQENPKIKL